MSQMEKCAYCGHYNPNTRDHIPPRCLFPKPLPSNLITVPCCESCRAGWSDDDEYFKTIILTSENLKGDPRAAEQLKSVVRALKKDTKRGFSAHIRNSMTITDLRTQAGLIVGRHPVVRFDNERIGRVLSRIVRGLFFLENGYPVPCTCSVESFIDQFGARSNELHKMAPFPAVKRAANNMFLYTTLKAEDNPNISIWLGAFYERVSFISFTGIENIKSAPN